MKSTFNSFPNEIVEEIGRELGRTRDQLSLAFVSRRVFRLVLPLVYDAVHVKGKACGAVVTLFVQDQLLASHVRSLRLESERSRQPGGSGLSRVVEKAAPYLYNLETFVWDMPNDEQRDGMWHALRGWCPKLKSIGTCFGPYGPSPRGPFYQFKHLRSVYLRFRECGRISDLEKRWGRLDPENEVAEHADILWKTIKSSSPGIEEVAIVGDTKGSRNSVKHLVYGRWPKLRKVAFESVPLHERAGARQLVIGADPLVQLLVSHGETLEEIQMPDTAWAQPTMPLVPPGCRLPKLKHFRGTIMQTLTLPCHETLQRLVITNVIPFEETATNGLIRALVDLRQLTSLTLSFCLEGIHTNENIRAILGRCSKLRNLDLSIFVSPSIVLEDLMHLLRLTPFLQTLRLTIVKHSREDAVTHEVRRLARSHLHLRELRLYFVGRGCRIVDQRPPPVVEFGDYTIIRGARPKLIVNLEVWTILSMPPVDLSPHGFAKVPDRPMQEEQLYRRGPYRISLIDDEIEGGTPKARRRSSQFFGRVLSRVRSRSRQRRSVDY